MRQNIKKALRVCAVPLTFFVSAAGSMYTGESIKLRTLDESAAYDRAVGIERAYEGNDTSVKILTSPYKAAASDWLLDYRNQLAREIFADFIWEYPRLNREFIDGKAR